MILRLSIIGLLVLAMQCAWTQVSIINDESNGDLLFMEGTTERARLEGSTGHFGIGINNPESELHIVGDQELKGLLKLTQPTVLPIGACTNGQLYFDGSEIRACSGSSWEDLIFESDEIFQLNSNIVSNEGGDQTNNDFVFGSPSLDDDGDATHDIRLFFDKSKGAFRAGRATSTQWDDGNSGTASVAFGLNNTASGAYSFASGSSNIASGSASFSTGISNQSTSTGATSFGLYNNSNASYAMAFGRYLQSSGTNSIVLGSGRSVGSRLTNIFANTLMIGFNSNVPTIMVTGGDGNPGTYGNVGIGTTTMTSTLDVKGNMAVGSSYAGTNAAPSNGLIVEGNVGIGTNNPNYNIEIYGQDAISMVHYVGNSRGGLQAISGQRVAFLSTASTDDLVFGYSDPTPISADFNERMRLDNGTGSLGLGTNDFSLGSHQLTHTPANHVKLAISGTDNYSASSSIASLVLEGKSSAIGDETGVIDFVNSPVAANNYNYARIAATSENSNQTYAALRFSTRKGTNLTEKMIIDEDGFVGIGSTAPTSLLDVSSGDNGDALLRLTADTDNNDEADNPGILFTQDGGAVDAFIGLEGNAGSRAAGTLANAFLIGSEDNDPALQFLTNDNVRMTIEADGDVGIGTTAPTGEFEIYSDPELNFNLRRDDDNEAAMLSFKTDNTNDWRFFTPSGGSDLYLRNTANSNVLFLQQSTGNVGVNTNAPSGRLSVFDDEKTAITIKTSNNSASNGLAFQNSGNSFSAAIYREDAGSNSAHLVFATDNAPQADIDNLSQRMIIQNDGNVGIGTTPSDVLEVEGAVVRRGFFQAFHNNGTGISGGYTPIPLVDIASYRNDDDYYDHTSGSTDVTIEEIGWYKITFSLNLQNDGTTKTARAGLHLNGVQVTGGVAYRALNGTEISSLSKTILIETTSTNSVLSLRLMVHDGGGSYVVFGTHSNITIEKI